VKRVPRARLRACQLAVLPCLLAIARAARAEPLPVALSWDAPPECPSQSEVMAELTRITRVKSGRIVTPISAQAKIERTNAGHYRLRLRTQREDQTGDTDLEAATCPVLKRGVTLVLALALGDGVDLIDERAPPPAAAPEPSPPAPTASSPPKPKPVTLEPGAREHADARRFTEPLRLAPWLAAAGAWALIDKPSLGGQFGLTLGQASWEALSRVTLWPRRTAVHVQGVDASFSAVVGAVGGCGRRAFGAWSLSACALFELGVVRGSSAGAFRDGSANAPYYAVGPSLVLTAPVYGALKLRLDCGLSIGIAPPHFAIESFGEVYAVARFVPTASLGLSFDPARTRAGALSPSQAQPGTLP